MAAQRMVCRGYPEQSTPRKEEITIGVLVAVAESTPPVRVHDVARTAGRPYTT